MNLKLAIVTTVAVSGASVLVTEANAAGVTADQTFGLEASQRGDQVFRAFLGKLDPFEFQRINRELRGHSFSM